MHQINVIYRDDEGEHWTKRDRCLVVRGEPRRSITCCSYFLCFLFMDGEWGLRGE